jgi:HAMP domain-containing protein
VPAGKNGSVTDVIFVLMAIAFAALLLISFRGRRSTDSSEAVRRDLGRLADELKAAVRDQVDRLDREVKRLQQAVADAERARLALEEASRHAVPRSPVTPPAAKLPSNPLHSRVFELRDAGKEPADIGVETGLEVGEVELILGLRRMPPRA